VTPGGNKPTWRALPLVVADGAALAPAGKDVLYGLKVYDAGVDRPRTHTLKERKHE
jgi:hypothetical protein